MKNFIAFIAFLFCLKANAQYLSENISLLGHWYNPNTQAEPTLSIKYNSVWGWVNPNDNKEYAILGSSQGTYFIDVTNPTTPTYRDYVAGRRNNCIWREYKTYGKYLYGISDDNAPNSLQIIDMSYLPDSVHVVYDDTTLFERAHTLFIDGNKLYCASIKLANFGGFHSMAVYSLSNPELPSLLRYLDQDDPAVDGVHDMLVRNDTVFASAGFEGLFIYKFTNVFTPINSLTSYTNQGYNHSSAITPDGKTLIFCDEVPSNLSVKTIDISDLNNINFLSLFKSNEGATAHNPYMFGKDKVVIAYYQDGLQIFDISTPSLPLKTGFFDTDTLKGQNDGYSNPPYHGCWGAYVDLPSKNILASDMQNGLYVLDAKKALGLIEPHYTNSYSIYPNPSNGNTSISIQLKKPEQIIYKLFDITGRKIWSTTEALDAGNTIRTIPTETLASGIYILQVKGNVMNFSEKIVKKR